jgi:hypothetical protein
MPNLKEALAMFLIWVMLLVLAASYGLCGALVFFAARAIQPRGLETAVLISQPSETTPKTGACRLNVGD